MSNTPKYSAPALDKGLEILELLASNASPLSQAEIASELDRTPNEIYRVLVGLEHRGYLIRDDVSGKYSLSLKLYTLSRTHSPVEQLRLAAHGPMEELASKVGQACHLSVHYNDQLLVVGQVKSPSPVSLSISEGTLFPLLSTVSGRVMLSQFSEADRERHVREHMSLDSNEQNTLLEQLESIRKDRSYLSDSSLTVGVTDCAAFIGRVGSGLMAAIAVSALSSSLIRDVEKETLHEAVKKAAFAINSKLGL